MSHIKTIPICVAMLGLTACGEVAGVDAPVDAETPPPDSVEPPPCVPPPAGLTAWWRADSSAADARDDWDGAIHGNPGFIPAEVGNGFELDGDDYITVDHQGALYPEGSFAIEAWIDPEVVRPDDDKPAPAQSVLVMYEGGNRFDGPSAITLKVTAERRLDLWARVSEAGQSLVTAATLAPGGRHHVVAVRNIEDEALELYIDGVREASAALLPGATGAFTAGTLDDDPLLIGASSATDFAKPTGDFFKGVIDELSYYKAALGPDQVAALHAAGSAGKCLR